ncbi:hypothetical protein RB595_006137 [Gaeumannomyces hyphopodioides]
MSDANPTTAVSAPGKVLLAGGYLVLDRKYTGLVLGLSARINVVAEEINTSPGVQLTEIVVESPQFQHAQWRYGYRLADEDGGIQITQLHVGTDISKNPFVETTLSYALTYIAKVGKHGPSHSMKPARLTILADNDYYSQPSDASSSAPKTAGTETAPAGARTAAASRFARFPTTLSGANKTGLGSSAALVTALSAALLTHYLPPQLFDLASDFGRAALHNLAQAAHCAAQGKVGSGFDVAAAVYGSCRYRRFSPDVLSSLPEPGAPGFGAALTAVVAKPWDAEIDPTSVTLPPGVAMRMCDVTCGTQTVSMVKTVLAWKARDEESATRLWDDLQSRNEALAAVLASGRVEGIAGAVSSVRDLVRRMGEESGAQIEPPSQTELLDALGGLEGVFGGVVPGAGGFDAAALLMRDDDETKARAEQFLDKWSSEKNVRVRLLGVKGEMEGVRMESLKVYEGWV